MQTNNNREIDELFRLVFNNIVISRLIFSNLKLYKKNECVIINDHPEREYIQKIVYNSTEVLKYGDLPIGGVLKEIVVITIKGEAIPYGVEIIEFSDHENRETLSLLGFPSSIHTIKNAIILPSRNNNDKEQSLIEFPPNITSISLVECPNISNNFENASGFVTIPNTIKTIKFGSFWNNQGIPLCKGNFPEGITSLSCKGYKVRSLRKDILPTTIKNLEISCYL